MHWYSMSEVIIVYCNEFESDSQGIEAPQQIDQEEDVIILNWLRSMQNFLSIDLTLGRVERSVVSEQKGSWTNESTVVGRWAKHEIGCEDIGNNLYSKLFVHSDF